jgi:hypothetical protein
MDVAEDRLTRALALAPEAFQRLYGVPVEVFREMVAVVRQSVQRKQGRDPALTTPAQVLCALEYWRDYPTFARLGFDWNIPEKTAHCTVTRVEHALVRARRFRLPGRKALLAADPPPPVVAVDVGETPIERPKKSSGGATAARSGSTPSRRRS